MPIIRFRGLVESLKYDVISALYMVQVKTETELESVERQKREQAKTRQKNMNFSHEDAGNVLESKPQEQKPEFKTTPVVRNTPKVGRNEPCPCGSGKKYKHCCGKVN